jgi:hypothetical protein
VREEDGADQIAALMMLQFGPKAAITTIKGPTTRRATMKAGTHASLPPSA